MFREFYLKLLQALSLVLGLSCISFATDLDYTDFQANKTLFANQSPYILMHVDGGEQPDHVIEVPNNVTIFVQPGVRIVFEDSGDDAIYKLVFLAGSHLVCNGTDEEDEEIRIDGDWYENNYWDTEIDQDEDPYTLDIYRQLEFQAESTIDMSYTEIIRFGTGIFIDEDVEASSISYCNFDRNYIAIEDRGTGTEISHCDFSGFLAMSPITTGIYQLGIKCYEASEFYYHDLLFDGWITANTQGARDVDNKLKVALIEFTNIGWDADINENEIRDCLFRNNEQMLRYAIRMTDSSPKFIDCSFNDDSDGEVFSYGVFNNDLNAPDDEPLIQGCLFHEGPIVYLSGADERLNTATIEDCQFTGVYAAADHAAINIKNDVVPTIRRNQFIDCSVGIYVDGYLGDVESLANAVIRNNLFIRDENEDWAIEGIRIRTNEEVEISNNIFSNIDNVTQEEDFVRVSSGIHFIEEFGFVFADNNTSIRNNIFHDDVVNGTGIGVLATDDDGFASDYNLYWHIAHPFDDGAGEENWEGNDDLLSDAAGDDPEFVNDPFGIDYAFYLDSDSPCIDAGDPIVDYRDLNHTGNDRGIYGGKGAEPGMEELYFGTITANATCEVEAEIPDTYDLTVEDIIFTIDEDFEVNGVMTVEDGGTLTFAGGADLIIDGELDIPANDAVTINSAVNITGTGTFDVNAGAQVTQNGDFDIACDMTVGQNCDMLYSNGSQLTVSGDLDVTGALGNETTFTESVVDAGWSGIRFIAGGGNNSDVAFANITQSTGNGVMIDGTYVDRFSNCNVSNNDVHGFFIIDNIDDETDIEFCTINNNTSNGLLLWKDVGGNLKMVEINNCTVHSNGETGLAVDKHPFKSLFSSYQFHPLYGISINGSTSQSYSSWDIVDNNSTNAAVTNAGIHLFDGFLMMTGDWVRNNLDRGMSLFGTSYVSMAPNNGDFNCIRDNGWAGGVRVLNMDEIFMTQNSDVWMAFGRNDIFDSQWDNIITRNPNILGQINGSLNYFGFPNAIGTTPMGLLANFWMGARYTIAEFEDEEVADGEFSRAVGLMQEEEYAEAFGIFEDLVLAQASIRSSANSPVMMLQCAKEIEYDLNELRTFLTEIEVNEENIVLNQNREYVGTQCLVELGAYEDAISEFNEVRLNAETLHDSVIAAVRILHIEQLLNRRNGGEFVDGAGNSIQNLLAMMNGENTVISTPVPQKFEFTKVYPNPFNSTVSIEFNLNTEAKTRISIHDITGREIESLYNDNLLTGGHTVTWKANDVPSGMYLCRIQADNAVITKKLTLMR